MSRDPTCVFGCDPDLVRRLEACFGPPIDSYLNGWQVWVEPMAGRPEVELEYRLHPPAGFRQPAGLSHHDLWEVVIDQLAQGVSELRLGREVRSLDQVWQLLEAYPALRAELTPEELRAAAETVLRRPALAAGYVDHDRLGGSGNAPAVASTWSGRCSPSSASTMRPSEAHTRR